MNRYQWAAALFVGLFFLNGTAISCDEEGSSSIKKYNLEKEKILNVVINSKEFNKTYGSEKLVFEENELLSVNSPLVLIRNGHKVKIARMKDIAESEHAVLGDFTMARKNPTRARVQIELPNKKLLLNFSLVKERRAWRIEHFVLMED